MDIDLWSLPSGRQHSTEDGADSHLLRDGWVHCLWCHQEAICKFLSANGPYVTTRNLYKRSIKANALLVCKALLQARVTRFVLVAFGMKQSLSSLQPLRQVQAPTAITPNRLDLGLTL